MIAYMTEEEQIAAIKKWWIRHSTKITVILSIIMLFMGGYRYWQWHHEKKMVEASNTYERLMVAFSNQDNPGVQAFARQLLTQYKKTIYADAARFILVKIFFDSNQGKAKEILKEIAHSSSLAAFRQIANLRLARLFLSEKEYQQALSLLEKVDDPSYQSMIDEVKGDVLVALNKSDEAKRAYLNALSENERNNINDSFLELKLKALGVDLAANTLSVRG